MSDLNKSKMISLYFNCRITDKSLVPNVAIGGFFYPVIYPKSTRFVTLSQFEVLCKTIKSYSPIQFDVAIFNISLDNKKIESITFLKKLIQENINCNKLCINFERPSTINDWKSNLVEARQLIGKNTPVLIVMNHDHLFTDYTTTTFMRVVNKTFNELSDNFGKALIYSHAPESIAEFLGNRYYLSDDILLIKIKSSRDLSSILIMTLETLEAYVENIEIHCDYIGRLIDWPGVTYKKFNLLIYIFPREFFKHYDGYGHITGLRQIYDLRSDINDFKFPQIDSSVSTQVDFYYQKWLDSFLLFIRDSLIQSNDKKLKKEVYVEAIENSITLFKKGYLEEDCKTFNLSSEWLDKIVEGLRCNIYYDANKLYMEISSEINLIEAGNVDRISKVIRKKIKEYIPNHLINKVLLWRLIRRKLENSN